MLVLRKQMKLGKSINVKEFIGLESGLNIRRVSAIDFKTFLTGLRGGLDLMKSSMTS